MVLFVTITMVMILPLIIAPIMLLLSSLLLSLLLACATARPHGRAVFSCRGMRGKNSELLARHVRCVVM